MDTLELVETGRTDWADRPPAICFVYEIWDDQNRLAYVGIADNFERRWRQHVASSWWLGEVTVRQVVVEGYRSRWDARQVEAAVINEQSPVYNTNREARSYEEYQGLFSSPERLADRWDCAPVSRRYMAGVAA